MDDTLPGSASDSDTDVYKLAIQIMSWSFSRENIEKYSPSRRDGIDLKTETRLRCSYCRFLQNLGEQLKVRQGTVATAIVFCHRFFTRQSHAKNDRWTIATICMVLAGKVEETPVDFKEVILAATCVRLKEKNLSYAQKKEAYEQFKKLVLSGEQLVLSTLNFDLFILHPFKPLLEAIKRYMGEHTKTELPKLAWTIVTDSLETTLCLQYNPKQIAAGVLVLAYELLAMDLPNGEVLYREFDITASQLEDIKGQILEIYVDERPVPTSQESIVESSGGVDAVHQPVSRDRDSKSTSKCPSSDVEGSQREDHSVHDGSTTRPEGIGEEKSEAGKNQDDQ